MNKKIRPILLENKQRLERTLAFLQNVKKKDKIRLAY